MVDGEPAGTGGGGDGDELCPVGGRRLAGDQSLDGARDAIGVGMGEHTRPDGRRAEPWCRVLGRFVVEQSLAAVCPFDALALGLDVECEVRPRVGPTGLGVLVGVVDPTLQRHGVEKGTGLQPRRVGVEWRDRFRHLSETHEEGRPVGDRGEFDPVDGDVGAVVDGEESGRQRGRVTALEERAHLVAGQRCEVVGVVERAVRAAALVVRLEVVGRERAPVETTARTPLAVDLHTPGPTASGISDRPSKPTWKASGTRPAG